MDIKVPAVGESVSEALVARWLKKDGETVARDEPVCEVETDKVTLEVSAESAGRLKIVVAEGQTVKIGTVIGRIEEGAAEAPFERKAAPEKAPQPPSKAEAQPQQAQAPQPQPAQPEAAPTPQAATPAPEQEPAPQAAPPQQPPQAAPTAPQPELPRPLSSPSGRKMARESGAAPEISGFAPPAPPSAAPAPERPPVAPPQAAAAPAPAGHVTRRAMSPIRKRIAERLVAAKQSTAMLTTFNEADLSQLQALRKRHGERFQQRHNVKLGLMSFFVRACCEALTEFPEINASIEGDEIVYHHFCDLGIAVGGEKGLVVPVLRSAETLSLAQIEQRIAEMSEKVRSNRITISDLEGGTFTISNGGIYGSLLSTPILNPPQSGVLGMHSIQERPVVRDGQVVIRPMMYLALSYDHRIVDGREAVGFLKLVKEYIESPEEMLLEG